jgi:hypothetical protein
MKKLKDIAEQFQDYLDDKVNEKINKQFVKAKPKNMKKKPAKPKKVEND